MFAEDLDTFLDVAAGFAVAATLGGGAVTVLFDAPGVDAFGGELSTTEPSVLVKASDDPDVGDALIVSGLPTALAHLAGTYTVRSVQPDAPDGAFVRAFLAKVS